MIYPTAPFCPFGDESNDKSDSSASHGKNTGDSAANQDNTVGNPLFDDADNMLGADKLSREQLFNFINELTFALVELNLFLDTHPDDEQALKTFTMLAAALKSYRHDYVNRYAPLTAYDSSDQTPFEWVSPENKWPWQN